MQARFYRNMKVTDVVPGDLVETDKGVLVVDSITLFLDHLDVSGLPPTRTEGRRVIASIDRTDTVQVVADEATAQQLFAELAGRDDLQAWVSRDATVKPTGFEDITGMTLHPGLERNPGDMWTLQVAL